MGGHQPGGNRLRGLAALPVQRPAWVAICNRLKDGEGEGGGGGRKGDGGCCVWGGRRCESCHAFCPCCSCCRFCCRCCCCCCCCCCRDNLTPCPFPPHHLVRQVHAHHGVAPSQRSRQGSDFLTLLPLPSLVLLCPLLLVLLLHQLVPLLAPLLQLPPPLQQPHHAVHCRLRSILRARGEGNREAGGSRRTGVEGCSQGGE